MGKVVELNKQPKNGDKTFMACPCTEEGTSFEVLVIMGDRPFIAALICPSCEQEVPVVNGYVGATG
ncbi:hypothetical protein EQG41_18260 [Billgrantia azerbaijanica]|nr:hypothetical protein EQG41_18260 [Halomonas azerbaijanica]